MPPIYYFRGLIIANTRSSSMRSWVIVFKSIHSVRVNGQNDAKTLHVDAIFFENGGKKLRFQTNTDTSERGLRSSLRIEDTSTKLWVLFLNRNFVSYLQYPSTQSSIYFYCFKIIFYLKTTATTTTDINTYKRKNKGY